jgi:hypothetical protein
VTPLLDQSSTHPSITEDVIAALLHGGRVVGVYSHEGSPGGHNNDVLALKMQSGDTVAFNIYSLYRLAVKVTDGARYFDAPLDEKEGSDA